MSASVARVVNVPVPPTVTVTASVMLPVVAVMLKSPPTAPSVAASINKSPTVSTSSSRFTSALSTNVMLPNVSLPSSALSVTAPVKSLSASSSIMLEPSVVVIKVEAPPTVSVPLSVISPPALISISPPPAFTAPNARLLPASTLTSPPLVEVTVRVPEASISNPAVESKLPVLL